ncbi:MAG: LicD family protein [Paludibacteraceae bacterium]|nr:LicD family protein [Paludibacteraceae bacterium]
MRDLVVKILVRIGLYKPIVDIINRAKFEVQARRMKRDGLTMLSAADKVFSEMGIKAFLTYGALLGAYRDHGFISYDPDIDLGILETEVPTNLHEKMEQAGFHLYRQNVMAETKQVVEETYIYKNLHLDIFYYIQEGQDLYSVIQRKHETKEWKEANATDGFPCDRSYVPACEFERREFLGLQIWMPVDTDGWLRAIYSDSYMTPIKNWNAQDGYVTRIIHTEERSYRRLC